MKSFLHKALARNNSTLFVRVNSFLGFITIISILSISLETVATLQKYQALFLIIEYIVVTIFTAEYIARIYIHEKKISYIFSFFGIIDLLAILPTYVGLTNLTYLKSARIIRVLHFLRTLRLMKLAKLNKFSNRNSHKSREIQSISIRIYAITLCSAIIFFGTLLYLFEGSNPVFKDIPTSALFTTQIILGGSADTNTFSMISKVVVVTVQFTGLLLFGLLIHIVGKFFERKLLGSTTIAE